MGLQAYRQVLALPRVRFTIILMFLARLPMTAMGTVLTLHVVNDLGRGYGEAGLVGTVGALAGGFGGPLVGRMIDRYGVRPVVVVSGAASTAFWVALPHISYIALLILALPAGMIALPAQSLTRQFLTALVPQEQRRAIFSLDMVLGEASFIVGPTCGILVITQLSSTIALTGIGIWLGLTAAMLFITNIPIRSEDETNADETTARPRMREWLNSRMLGGLIVNLGAMFTLIGTEIAVIATMQAQHQTSLIGVVMAGMSVASIVGGLYHGTVRRSLPQWVLAMLLGGLLIPVGLADHPWWLLIIVLIPMNLMCTPALAAGAELISELAPAQARGEAMGLLGTTSSVGMGIGNPSVGFCIDRSSPAWGFAAAGLGGLLLAAVGAVIGRAWRPAVASEAEADAESAQALG
jgi:MFS family permease